MGFISRKDVYLHHCMSSIEKFNETRLFLKENFYSQPNECGTLDERLWARAESMEEARYYDDE